ncbi:hypothetical protein QR680_001028 [Steinernema hermaphroditum]|uniref:Uncharacterized protein n=1 Tax=Steinernema hermaphroditum TaxID=289476 RepID=A0AA39LFC2_9BILA|nr:hypothetical protein QR680_001028 [Steinernema hermaphroditum]
MVRLLFGIITLLCAAVLGSRSADTRNLDNIPSYHYKPFKGPAHYYGAHQGNIRSGKVPDSSELPLPEMRAGTLAPHVCGFNPYTRECMDPENLCPGRCMNFRYTYNVLYDCRCLAI